jgi:alkanesulfonate monooxygenase SsuD/methylene tetrahydromethanopterin reductase-like flavin-dependent oxidoreductase (luciferase family)
MADGPHISVWTDARPDLGETDGRRRYAELLDEARLADSLPYRSFCTTEQHGVDDGYMPQQLTIIAGLGTVTERIRFITSALLLLFHPLRSVVEQTIVADLLTGGRVELGVAAGGFKREFDLFGVDMSQRGRLMEEALPLLRMGLSEQRLPDGPDGSMLPVLPPPAQPRVPIYLGGLAPKVIDRAARLTDGVVPYDFLNVDDKFPAFYESVLAPAMQRHDRTLEDFKFILCTSLWATDDPEKDYEELFRPALEYQFGQYTKWAAGQQEPGYATPDTLKDRANLLVDTPENIAKRLLEIRERAPFHELMFWYRFRGIPHGRAMEHLELVADRVVPLLASQQEATPA